MKDSNFKPLRIAFSTLGCKVNFAETSHLIRQISSNGRYEVISDDNIANVYVVHSCILTSNAEKKTRQLIMRHNRKNSNAAIIVLGCMSQLASEQLINLPGVRAILGNDAKFFLLAVLEKLLKSSNNNSPKVLVETKLNEDKFHIAWSSTDRTRAFLKIQDGCDSYCSYCIVPYARGRSRSATLEQIIEALHSIASEGFREVVLTGINLSDFGKEQNLTIINLLKEIEKISLITRVRLSSIEPHFFTEKFVKNLSECSKLMPHFHLPVQSGSNSILKRMKRKYNSRFLMQIFEMINKIYEHPCLACDVIVGFPGEQEDEFKESLNFFEEAPISYMHVFPYSVRKQTKAASFSNQLNNSLIKCRSKLMIELSNRKLNKFYENNIGQIREVLFEGIHTKDRNQIFGYTDNYVRVIVPYDFTLVNKIHRVKLLEVNREKQVVLGEII